MIDESAIHIHLTGIMVICILQKSCRPFKRYQCPRQEIWIGREESCDLIYKLATISKKHCRLFFQGQWYIEDLKSANGTYLNEKRIQKSPIKIGDCLSLGGLEIWFGECFILAMMPDFSKLPVFIFQPSRPKNVQCQEIPEIVSPPQMPECLPLPVNSFPFSFSRDILTMLIYPAFMLFQGKDNYPYYAYAAILVVIIRLSDYIWRFLKDKYQSRKQQKDFCRKLEIYQLNMQNYYPNCLDLEKQFLLMGRLMIRDKPIVRLGMTHTQEVLLHDFEQFPHLVIKGNKQQTSFFIMQIIYQLLVYAPNISVYIEQKTIDYCFCLSCLQKQEVVLWVGPNAAQVDKTHFWIEEIVSFNDAKSGFDALLDLDKCQYITDHTQSIVPDNAFDSALFSHHYAFFQRMSHPDLTYEKLLGLDRYTIRELRNQFLIEQQLSGCIGYFNDQPLYLDLHEQRDGPHLLIAGMTGSGKSEWLISYLFSLAVFYDSRDVQFLFIDFKGGSLAKIFEALPHTVMVLTDLDTTQIIRAIAALEDELRQRERVFLDITKQFGLANPSIHDLKRLQRLGKITVDLAHLIIIVDEFAELKLLYPEMMLALIRIARVGRSLGIHLILSTQRPSGVIDGQILSNVKTRICLKVASRQDSYEVLSKNDAAFLKQPGEFYCQKDDFGQLIYGRSLLISPAPSSLVLYDLDHIEKIRIPLNKSESSSHQFLISQLKEISSPSQPLYYQTFRKMNDEERQKGGLGIYDDYVHRQMPVLYHDFKENGPMLVVGASEENLQCLSSHWAHVQVINQWQELDLKAVDTIWLLNQFSYQYIEPQQLQKNIDRQACIFIEKDVSHLKSWLLDRVTVYLVFDQQMAENLFFTRIPFHCDKEKHIGVLRRKGAIYRCQIQAFVY